MIPSRTLASALGRTSYFQTVTSRKVLHPVAKNHLTAPGTSELGVAGALGFEPRLSVLETDVLPLTPCPSSPGSGTQSPSSTSLWGGAFRRNLQNLFGSTRLDSFFFFLTLDYFRFWRAVKPRRMFSAF